MHHIAASGTLSNRAVNNKTHMEQSDRTASCVTNGIGMNAITPYRIASHHNAPDGTPPLMKKPSNYERSSNNLTAPDRNEQTDDVVEIGDEVGDSNQTVLHETAPHRNEHHRHY